MSNITSLERLNNETIAEVAPINNNFETLRVAVNDNDGRITSLRNETSYNISNVNSTIQSTKESLLENIATVTNDKVNISGNNFNATGKAVILDLVAPNYTAGYSISSGWTAPKSGWCYFGGQSDGTSSVTIDSTYLEVSWDKDDGQSRGELFVFVGKGSTISNFQRIREAKFFPCKGN